MRFSSKQVLSVITMLLMPTSGALALDELASAETASGYEARITDAIRSDGVLTVMVQFRPGDGAAGSHTIYGALSSVFEDGIYITADSNRHLLLVDSEGVALAPQRLSLSRNTGANWHGQFPAPEDAVTHFSLTLPDGIHFPRVPIRDD